VAMDKSESQRASEPQDSKGQARFVGPGKFQRRHPGISKRLRMVGIFSGLAALVFVIFLVWINSSGNSDSETTAATYIVRRGPLTISVTESGTIKARNTFDIKSEVEGEVTILSIVDEGTYISLQDVNEGKVLVELDSSRINEQLSQQEITHAGAKASYTEAKEAYEIQIKQNESDIKAGQMKVRFGLMDLQKYLGEKVAGKLIGNPEEESDPTDEIASLSEGPELGGGALQKLRELQSDIDLAEEKLKRAEDKLDWTQKLYDKQYVARTELEADRLEVKRLGIELEQARTSLKLFRRYEFPKEAEKLLSDYQESQRELQRIEAKARSKEAQAQAKLDSSEAQYKLQKERLEKLQKQLNACVIKASKPGMIVYGTSGDFWASRNRPIEEGGSVYERQKIISIPDMGEMAVDVKIHESWVDKVEPNLPAKITIDAFPDKAFKGEVLKVAPLADPQAFWLDTGLKVYTTEVSIEGTDYSLKPGMSAKVEIVIQELSDVISVPVQAVANREGSKVCYVMGSSEIKPYQVKTGVFNDSFIEIEEGLNEGQKVLLAPPRYVESQVAQEEKTKSLPNNSAEIKRAGPQ